MIKDLGWKIVLGFKHIFTSVKNAKQ